MSDRPFELLGDEGDQCADGVCEPPSGAERAHAAITASGIPFTATQHGPVSSLAEAAAARGVEPRRLVKTMVVRRTEGEYVLVLVPGDRSIAWPKLRRVLGVNRVSMPGAEGALAATGYERGTVTPFGSIGAWPVIVDASIEGEISIGGGDHGRGFTLDAGDLISAVDAQVADVAE